jgi:hypothetical protein
VNTTGELTKRVVGRKVKLADNGGEGWIVTIWELVTVREDEDESVAVSVTVKGWALE